MIEIYHYPNFGAIVFPKFNNDYAILKHEHKEFNEIGGGGGRGLGPNAGRN